MKYIDWLLAIVMVLLLYEASRGQCYPDRHNTSHNSAWLSCTASQSPNPARGVSHWIQYDLGFNYPLGVLHYWNYNYADDLDNGLKDVVIDVSADGVDWQEISQMEFIMASGESIYQGRDGPNLGGVVARYVLITAQDNWGGDCFGLSEIRLGVANPPDCVNELDLTGNIWTDDYLASQRIMSDGIVPVSSMAVFKAGQEVSLEPGFVVEKEATLQVIMENCSDN